MQSEQLKALQAPLEARYRDDTGRAIAEGDLDFRGTLGVEREAPVGFEAIRLRFDLDTDADDEQLDTLLKLTECYCVVFQTLTNTPEPSVSR